MSEQGSTRLKYIDAIKGFAIILVVLGHVLDGYLYSGFAPESNRLFWSAFNIIYIFHMPLMMMISGYMFIKAYYISEENGIRLNKERYRRHLANLVFVYILFSMIHGFIKLRFSGIVSEAVSVQDILNVLIKTIAPFWYLYILIIYYIIFPFVIKAFYGKKGKRDNKETKVKSGFVVVLTILFFMIMGLIGDFIISQTEESLFEGYRVFRYSIFFAMGILFALYSEDKSEKSDKTTGLLIFCIMFVAGIIICTVFWDRTGWRLLYKEQGIGLLAGVLLCPAIWVVFSRLLPDRFTGALQFVGRYSLDIYVMHILFTAAIRVILIKTGFTQPFITILLNAVLSLAVSIAVALILKAMHLHRFIYKPFSGLKKEKSIYIAVGIMFTVTLTMAFIGDRLDKNMNNAVGLYNSGEESTAQTESTAEAGELVMTDTLADSLSESADLRILNVISNDFYSGKRLAVHMDAAQDLLSIEGIERLYVEIYSGIKKVGVAEMYFSGAIPGAKESDNAGGNAAGSGDIWVYDSGIYIEDYYIHNAINLTVKVKVKARGKDYTVAEKNIERAYTTFSDIYECLAELRSGRYIAFIAVKDDASNNLDEKMAELFRELGTSLNLSDAVRKGFGIVIDGNTEKEVIAESTDDTVFIEDSITNDLTEKVIDYKIVSSGYEAENKAEITVNGKQYALNIRGINIVLYDKKTDKVISSAVFDTFSNAEKYLMRQEDLN